MDNNTELVIDRAIWLRGEGNEASTLLRPEDSKRCCLGIHAGNCGIPDIDIRLRAGLADIRMPLEHLQSIFPQFITSDDLYDNALCLTLMGINDCEIGDMYNIYSNRKGAPGWDIQTVSSNLLESEQQREALITEWFAQAGINVTFIN